MSIFTYTEIPKDQPVALAIFKHDDRQNVPAIHPQRCNMEPDEEETRKGPIASQKALQGRLNKGGKSINQPNFIVFMKAVQKRLSPNQVTCAYVCISYSPHNSASKIQS